MRILIHDYAGHPFTTALSRELARLDHEVAHVFASDLQTPRGDMKRRASDANSLAFHEVPMDPEYPRFKYKFLRRRRMEIGYGRRAGDFIRQWKPDTVLSGNTPTEAQEPITRATLDAWTAYEGFQGSSGALSKAACFNIPALATAGECIGNRVETYRIGLTIPEANVGKATEAIDHLLAGRDWEGQALNPRYQEFRQLHSLDHLDEIIAALVARI